ncbi:MAG: IPT/TIG domain-containing protein [Bacteroidota bacterium]|jgi:hypothetical protein|nr:IPT/TIG domain-containing protein [Bacteroidota bacterium]
MTFRLLPFFLVAAMLVVVACSDDDDSTPITPTDRITVSNFSPISGPIGTMVTVSGTNYGTDPSALTITVGGVVVTPVSVTNTEITFRIPSSLPMGATTIKIQKGSGTPLDLQFLVEDPIVGVWVSDSANVAPLLYGAPFHVRKIVATFKANGTYTVVQTDSSQTSLTLTGVWFAAVGGAAAPNDKIRTITVNQGTPSALTAEGIYEVTVDDGKIMMNYEVVQTEPPLAGVSKPTAEGGFGSTAGGTFGMINVQKYVRTN